MTPSRPAPILRATVRLADEVQKFSIACDRLLALIRAERPLTKEEALMIEYYCKELHVQIASQLPPS